MARKAYGVGKGIMDLIRAEDIDDFSEVMFVHRDELNNYLGANRAHCLDHEMVDKKDEDDSVYEFADDVVEVLGKVETKEEMEDLLREIGVNDYIDYILFLFPEFEPEERVKICGKYVHIPKRGRI